MPTIASLPKDTLFGLLEMHLDNTTCEKIYRAIHRFYEIARKGKLSLKPKDELNYERIRKAIAQTLREDQNSVELAFYSVSHPIAKLAWMSEQTYAKMCQDSLGDSLRDSLWDYLEDSLRDSLGDSLGNSLRNSLGDSLRDSLRNSLGDSLRDSLRDSLGDSLGNSLWISLRDSLFYYLGFMLVGKQELADRLVPLLRVLPDALVIGKHKDNSNVWIVISA